MGGLNNDRVNFHKLKRAKYTTDCWFLWRFEVCRNHPDNNQAQFELYKFIDCRWKFELAVVVRRFRISLWCLKKLNWTPLKFHRISFLYAFSCLVNGFVKIALCETYRMNQNSRFLFNCCYVKYLKCDLICIIWVTSSDIHNFHYKLNKIYLLSSFIKVHDTFSIFFRPCQLHIPTEWWWWWWTKNANKRDVVLIALAVKFSKKNIKIRNMLLRENPKRIKVDFFDWYFTDFIR